MADVTCDWREVTLVQDRPDRVRASGARGRAATTTYKVTATHVVGYRALTTAMFAGTGAAGKARRMAEALLARTARLAENRGLGALSETSIEVVGTGDVLGSERNDAATEAVVKIGVAGPDKATLELFAREFAGFALVAQGMTGVFAGRPRVAPAIAVHHLLADKAATPMTVVLDDETFTVEIAPGSPNAVISTLRYDPQGKSYAAMLLTMPVTVPRELLS